MGYMPCGKPHLGRDTMSDRPFQRLNDQWMLGYDARQWVVMKAEKNGPGDDLRSPAIRWRAVSFIASTKKVLLRVLGERGVKPTPEAQAVLDDLPLTFKQWIKGRDRPEMRAAEKE